MNRDDFDWSNLMPEASDFALDPQERSGTQNARVTSTISISNTPVCSNDGLGVRIPEIYSPVLPGSSPHHRRYIVKEGDTQRGRINQHLLEILTAADEQKVRQKRVRFDDLGASPRKRARLVTRLEEVVHGDEYEQCKDLESGSDLIKLQMLALSVQKQDKERLTRVNESLEKELKGMRELAEKQSERRIWVMREIVMRRGQDLKAHGQFLLDLAEKEMSLDLGA